MITYSTRFICLLILLFPFDTLSTGELFQLLDTWHDLVHTCKQAPVFNKILAMQVGMHFYDDVSARTHTHRFFFFLLWLHWHLNPLRYF